jgi:hypothetical protein
MRVERNTTHAALHAAGAVTVRQIDAGVFEVEPDIDLTLLDAAELDTAKTTKRQAVTNERNRRIVQGLVYTFPDGVTGTIQLRPTDVGNVNGVATKGNALLQKGDTTTTQPFRDKENATHTLTPQQAVDMGIAVSDRVEAIYQASWDHKDAIAALTTVADVDAYDISTGWPP